MKRTRRAGSQVGHPVSLGVVVLMVFSILSVSTVWAFTGPQPGASSTALPGQSQDVAVVPSPVYLPYQANGPFLRYLPFQSLIIPPTPTATPTATPTPLPTLTLTPPPGVPPPNTVSRYMSTLDPLKLNYEGCAAHDQSGIFVLDFGQPWYQGGTYGTWLFNNSFASIAQIQAAAQSWLQGYWNCSAVTSTDKIVLALGTSNYGSINSTNNYYAHGQAWGQMVAWLNSWLASTGYNIQETAAGAIDAEPSWNTAALTDSWPQGFYAGTTSAFYYNFGSADGCPPYGPCANGWSQYDVWYMSWGATNAWAVPEIYYNSLALEWYNISLYGYLNHGKAVTFAGEMTEYAADPSTNTPAQGWQDLYDALNGDSRTLQWLPWSTDITWAN